MFMYWIISTIWHSGKKKTVTVKDDRGHPILY